MKLLITGSSGFIGSSLMETINHKNIGEIIGVVREARYQKIIDNTKKAVISHIDSNSNWSEVLYNIDTVIHLAARAHNIKEKTSTQLIAFRETNTYATLNLAQQAANIGVKRFIFISSIAVNGTRTFDKPFTITDKPNPIESHAISKHEAEIGLRQIAIETDMEVVIIRPPLVYGANAPGNFGQLIKIVERNIPLPFGSIHNQRSLVALPNLIDLICTCITHSTAANQTFLVSDGEDISTTQLIQRLSQALGKPARLLPIPQNLLETSLNMLGKCALAQRLCGNLQIDMTQTCEVLGWTPPVSVDKALHQTAQAYLQTLH